MTTTHPDTSKGVTPEMESAWREFLAAHPSPSGQIPVSSGTIFRAGWEAALSLPAPGEGCEPKNLDERMVAAGMIPLSKLLSGDTPLAKWEAHTGVRTLAHFEEWLLRRHREIKTMHADYALGDKDESDELYEWVLAHSGAFSEVVANWRQVSAMSILSTPSAGGLGTVKALEWRKGYCNDRVTIQQASFGGLYQVRVLDGVVWVDWPSGESTEFQSVDAAKSAVQADCVRILSALDRTSLPPTEGMVP